MTADIEPRSIDLAQEPAFRLAGLEVHPATLEVVAGDRREQLEPRVMQVLVALARRRGEVVSRDELNDLCWGGRIVGDDAINRCVQRLRKVAKDLGGFVIETVPRVGFRLVEAGAARSRRRRRLLAVGALALALVVIAAAAVLRENSRTPEELRVAVAPFEALAPSGRNLAARLTDNVRGMVVENVAGVSVAGPGDRIGGAGMIVRGSVSRERNGWRVRTYLEEPRSRTLLSSAQFEQPLAAEDALPDEVAAAVTETISMVMDARRQRGLDLDPQTLAIYLAGSPLVSNPNPLRQSESTRAFQQVLARSPDFVAARAAVALALSHQSRSIPPADAPAMRARARAEAERAIRTDPTVAAGAYDALFELERLERPRDLARAEAILKEGIAKTPSFPWVSMRRCAFLTETGYVTEALGHCARASAVRPVAGPVARFRATAILASGDRVLAERAIDRAARLNPNHISTRLVRFEMAAFGGPPDRASTLLHDPQTAPQRFNAEAVVALDAFLTARRTGAPADIDVALRRLESAAASASLDGRYIVMAAVMLDRIDTAFAVAGTERPDIGAERPERPTYLFLPAMAEMRRDPRFWALAEDLGLVTYWRSRGVWPDFCSDPRLKYSCDRPPSRG